MKISRVVATAACVAFLSGDASAQFGLAAAVEKAIPREAGSRRIFDAPVPQVREATVFVMQKYRRASGWTFTEGSDRITAVFIVGGTTLTETYTFEESLAGTSLHALTVSSRDNAAHTRGENEMLDLISEALVTVRLKAQAASPAAPAVVAEPVYTSDADEPLARAAKNPDDYALIVGIDQYQALPAAKFGQRDAESFKRYAVATLGIPEENVILLTGARATRTGLAKYIEEWLPRNVSEKSRLWFFYSGHGAPEASDGTAYLLPWDGDPAYLKTSAYPLSTLYAKLSATKAREIIVALDSCFSGVGDRSLIAAGTRPLVSVVVAKPASSKLTALTASAANETAGSLDSQGHGAFTYYLLKGLGGAAAGKDGHVTMESMRSYVLSNVQREARRQNREQTPQLVSGKPSLRIY